MANSLGRDIQLGERVVLSARAYKGTEKERIFICDIGGFGMFQSTNGTAIFGKFESDGEKCRINGYDIERALPAPARAKKSAKGVKGGESK